MKAEERAATLTGSELELVGISKAFGSTQAARDCNLSVGRGEVIALLGPSGCGKSTLLNIVAGFETPDSGSVLLRGKKLNDVPPHKRNVAMVFQHYALFPHLTAADNIAYGLRARRKTAAQVRERVDAMLALLKLDGLGGRYPSQLSGGQRQRVAIARALAVDPDILLLDESFSALDKNLREEMQLELSLLLHRLHITTILVTHDQREAFSLADRVAVMEAGRIAQIGTPREMYETPVNSYVLQFLGSSNRLSVEVTREGESARIQIAPGLEFTTENIPEDLVGKNTALLHLRTEDVLIGDSPSAVHRAEPGVITFTTFLGAQERVVILLGSQQIIVDRQATSRNQRPAELGAKVYLDFDPARGRLSVVS
ncbi:MAG: ABC transporter ATP-binding protein [Xanthobacteraceae bacterium]|nr:ABC transporter ATP-binding protein [Xanthobacteraceae bacterium]